jgi:hypothetical protein
MRDVRTHTVEIYSPRKDKLMDRIPHIDKQQEGTPKSTGKAGPKPWDLKQYTYKEKNDDHRVPHSDPRLDALQSYDRHQDSDFIPYDDDHGYGSPVSSSGFTPQLDARASTASEWGTLAGGGCVGKPKRMTTEQALAKLDQLEYQVRLRNSERNLRAADNNWRGTKTIEQRVNDIRPR